MKVLSLMQPWATLSVLGLKTIETRNWATDYRGPLLIHASRSKAGKGVLPLPGTAGSLPSFEALPFGCIIGEVELYDIVRGFALQIGETAFEQQSLELGAFGDAAGKYCWCFRQAVSFDELIPATGRLGLWEF